MCALELGGEACESPGRACFIWLANVLWVLTGGREQGPGGLGHGMDRL